MSLRSLTVFCVLLFALCACGGRINVAELAFVSQHHIQLEKFKLDNDEVLDGEFQGGGIVGSNVPPVVDNAFRLPATLFPNEIEVVWKDITEGKVYHAQISEPPLSVRAKSLLKDHGISESEARLVLVFLEKGELGVWLQAGEVGLKTKINQKMMLVKGNTMDVIPQDDFENLDMGVTPTDDFENIEQ